MSNKAIATECKSSVVFLFGKLLKHNFYSNTRYSSLSEQVEKYLPCQILHPFIFPETCHNPGNLTDFIQTGTGINRQW